MVIGIGCDHGGINLKDSVIKAIKETGNDFIDYGTFDNTSVDYPHYAKKVALAIVNKEVDKGVLMCGTGIGISIAANKVRGIRCAHCTDTFSAEMSVRHNNADILAIGGRISSENDAFLMTKIFLTAEFEGGRHQSRIDKIIEIENEN